jgi:Sigma-70, region 4
MLRGRLRTPREGDLSLPPAARGRCARGGAHRRDVRARLSRSTSVRSSRRSRAALAIRNRCQPPAHAPARGGAPSARLRPRNGAWLRAFAERGLGVSPRCRGIETGAGRGPRRPPARSGRGAAPPRWADLSHEEIAAALDISAETVRSRLHRARAHVAERLARSGNKAGDDSMRTTP